MKTIKFGHTDLNVPVIAVGCMRMAEKTPEEMNRYLHNALDLDINFFDHADIYGGGKSEEVFGKALAGDTSIKREDLIIQSKCSICKGMYDESKEHILKSVDGILRRLQMDYLDVLLIHRPDALVEPEEVAEAFDVLKSQGKVRHFGVSNHRPSQIMLLEKYTNEHMQANQLQFSIPVSNMVAGGMEVNMDTPGSFDHDGSVLDYCRLNDITIQTWSPFQRANWQGTFIDSPACPELNDVLGRLAWEYGVTKTAIAAAWILRHPAKMQLIAGTASKKHLAEIAEAAEITLSRKEWYELYLAAGHILP